MKLTKTKSLFWQLINVKCSSISWVRAGGVMICVLWKTCGTMFLPPPHLSFCVILYQIPKSSAESGITHTHYVLQCIIGKPKVSYFVQSSVLMWLHCLQDWNYIQTLYHPASLQYGISWYWTTHVSEGTSGIKKQQKQHCGKFFLSCLHCIMEL